MSKYDSVKDLTDDKFKRLTGIHRKTFDKMIELLEDQYRRDRVKGSRHRKISIQDILLMTLEYLREYRTYYHVSVNYGVSEGSAYKMIIWTENTLIKSKEFSLPKRKELIDNNDIEVILVDATESPIERPKRNYEQKKFTEEKKERALNKNSSISRC